MATPALDQKQTGIQTRAFIIAWAFTVIFYFLEYAVRSSPSVMIPELEASFETTALGISAILGAYYYTYSTMSLVAGAALDHLGAKRTVPVGVRHLGYRVPFFSGRLRGGRRHRAIAAGAGSAFAFTGAVYLAAHGFSARYLATAIGATQCVGMLGGSAGQFVVGPMIERGLDVHAFWVGLGVIILAVAVSCISRLRRSNLAPHAQGGGFGFGPEAVQDCFLESSVVSLRSCCRAAVRTHHDWRHDLGSRRISKRSATFLSQRGAHRFHGSARLGCRMPAAGMAFGPHRKAQTGDHGKRGGHDPGCRSRSRSNPSHFRCTWRCSSSASHRARR